MDLVRNSGTVKVSWSRRGACVVDDSGQLHSTNIANYNRRHKGKEIPFDEWVRLIIDNDARKVYIRVAHTNPQESFDRQYDAVEALNLASTGYKIKFNSSQDELRQLTGEYRI